MWKSTRRGPYVISCANGSNVLFDPYVSSRRRKEEGEPSVDGVLYTQDQTRKTHLFLTPKDRDRY